jgi:hypothetical protein
MGYMHIENLYKNQTILLFRRCWALEKVHGTSAHVRYRTGSSPVLGFSSGSVRHDRFAALFDAADLTDRIARLGYHGVTIHGEAYGGSLMGMRATYGDALRFIAFDVQVGEHWLSVPDADQVVTELGLEFVPYLEISTDLEDIDQARDAPSVVAHRRGCGGGQLREGVILRPLIEVTLNSGHRVVAKHKRDAFSERATPQKIVDAAQLAILAEARAIAREWVTPMRLTHVLDRLPRPLDMTMTRQVIAAMVADVYREAAGEVAESREATTEIGRRTASLFQDWLREAANPDASTGEQREPSIALAQGGAALEAIHGRTSAAFLTAHGSGSEQEDAEGAEDAGDAAACTCPPMWPRSLGRHHPRCPLRGIVAADPAPTRE